MSDGPQRAFYDHLKQGWKLVDVILDSSETLHSEHNYIYGGLLLTPRGGMSHWVRLVIPKVR